MCSAWSGACWADCEGSAGTPFLHHPATHTRAPACGTVCAHEVTLTTRHGAEQGRGVPWSARARPPASNPTLARAHASPCACAHVAGPPPADALVPACLHACAHASHPAICASPMQSQASPQATGTCAPGTLALHPHPHAHAHAQAPCMHARTHTGRQAHRHALAPCFSTAPICNLGGSATTPALTHSRTRVRTRAGDCVYLFPEDESSPHYIGRLASAFVDDKADDPLCIEVDERTRFSQMGGWLEVAAAGLACGWCCPRLPGAPMVPAAPRPSWLLGGWPAMAPPSSASCRAPPTAPGQVVRAPHQL